MARRRMFSLDIVDTDLFLDMPSSVRLLYYDLGMRADDEGFVTPQKILRLTGASGDDLKILIGKGFAHIFEDGVLVILHWNKNNYIQSDRKTLSEYHNKIPLLEGINSVYKMDTQVRLGKNSIEKEKINKREKAPPFPKGRELFDTDAAFEEAIAAWEASTGRVHPRNKVTL